MRQSPAGSKSQKNTGERSQKAEEKIFKRGDGKYLFAAGAERSEQHTFLQSLIFADEHWWYQNHDTGEDAKAAHKPNHKTNFFHDGI